MTYRLAISEAAIEMLRALPKEARRNIGYRLDLLCADLQGDVKKLGSDSNRYRLRVGSYRVLFTLERDLIAVYRAICVFSWPQKGAKNLKIFADFASLCGYRIS